jgi:hypothetical protein
LLEQKKRWGTATPGAVTPPPQQPTNDYHGDVGGQQYDDDGGDEEMMKMKMILFLANFSPPHTPSRIWTCL